MSHPSIVAENLTKYYRLGTRNAAPDTLVSAVKSLAYAPLRNLKHLRRLDTFSHAADCSDGVETECRDAQVFRALNNVSFEVAEGDVVGIMGRNGAGKSTLLKVLSKITEPTSGRALICGRVSSLLEVGTGFHPELTGRDNIFMNGTILGMTKREIDRKFDEIVDFSGVERFLDTPVKHYSSGMQVRLAFAVAAHLEPEILIVDEVLTVGDAEFQSKCIGKMQDVAHGGRTVLFVSHNMAAVNYFCNRGIVLTRGEISFDGPTEQAVEVYTSSFARKSHETVENLDDYRDSWCKKVIKFARIANSRSEVHLGDALTIEMGFDCRSLRPLRSPVMTIVFHRLGTGVVGSISTHTTGFIVEVDSYGVGHYRCTLPKLPFIQGHYQIDIRLADGSEDVDALKHYLTFEIIASDYYGSGKQPRVDNGPVLLDANWEFTPCLKAG